MPPPLAPDFAGLVPDAPRFTTHADALDRLEALVRAHPDVASFRVIGESEEGRPIAGITLGTGPARVSLIAGCHADEPVGPETLRALVAGVLMRRADFDGLLRATTLCVVPHANPDGEARNRPWIERWSEEDPEATLGAYVRHVVREPPGRDVEFGFPAMRPENRAVAAFLAGHGPQTGGPQTGGPFALHASLHGMAFSEGAMLLVERAWAGEGGAPDRTAHLRAAFAAAAHAAGLRLHDHDRGGEKGFAYLGAGFTTTPEGAAMRRHFEAAGDPATAALFGNSSMEFVRALGTPGADGPADGDPGALALVTELPLFVVPHDPASPPGVPAGYLAFRAALPAIRTALEAGDAAPLGAWGLRPLPLAAAMRLQMQVLTLGLQRVLPRFNFA